MARVPFTIAAGTSSTIRITLNATGRQLLSRFYRLPAQLTVTGTAGLTAPVTFSLRRIRATVAYNYLLSAGYTHLSALTLSNVPRAARVVLRCQGRGCPFARRGVRRSGSRMALARLLAGRALAPGATVEVSVTAPGKVGAVLILRMRDGAPRLRDRCLPPGARRPQVCPAGG